MIRVYEPLFLVDRYNDTVHGFIYEVKPVAKKPIGSKEVLGAWIFRLSGNHTPDAFFLTGKKKGVIEKDSLAPRALVHKIRSHIFLKPTESILLMPPNVIRSALNKGLTEKEAAKEVISSLVRSLKEASSEQHADYEAFLYMRDMKKARSALKRSQELLDKARHINLEAIPGRKLVTPRRIKR